MENTEKLQKKLTSIRRGAYWFGIVGRLSIILGVLTVVMAISAGLAVCYNWPSITSGFPWLSSLLTGLPYLIYGYLFLLGRDAFEAIEELIREVGEIV